MSMPSFSPEPNATRDALIRVLSKHWPLTAKELHRQLNQQYSIQVTYQAVHKILQQLVHERIVVATEGGYQLDLIWIRSLRKFSEEVEQAYTTNTTKLLEIGVGSSIEFDAFSAGKEAAEKAIAGINLNKECRLALVFAAVAYEDHFRKLIKGIRSVIGNCEIAGCTSFGGEIDDRAQSKSVVVALFAGTKENFEAFPLTFEVGKEYYEGGESGEIITKIKKLKEEKSLDCGIIFFPGYTMGNKMAEGNVSGEFLKQWNREIGEKFILVGALAGDDWRFQKTWTMSGNEAQNNTIVFVGIKTKAKVGVGMEHAYHPIDNKKYTLFSKNGFVTEISSNGGKPMPATAAYGKITGLPHKELEKIIPSYIKEIIAQNKNPPVGQEGSFLIAFPILVEGSKIRFQNEYQDREQVRFLYTNTEQVIETTVQSLRKAHFSAGIRKSYGALVFPCTVLDLIFSKGPREVDHIKKIREFANVPIFGCYVGGEIGMVEEKGCTRGNGTFTCLVFGE